MRMDARDFNEYEPCPHCDELVHCDDLCEVPMAHPKGPDIQPVTEWTRFCCSDCYDEVCEEEGFNPQDDQWPLNDPRR